ncbi:MAG: AAA family ATPase [Rhodospirillaceae bacterium]|jgi:chromosome partitioning protein|nr:AAA family ATPase [Rhodospirillales bacterium]MBT3904591.1 AAA family ATPase [Rhodospirillaceae bacterium]MBT4702080.1 AAA family ATPase [Rhodospirillaceae bacterium]MBT5034410.1 AAA family ATPase [Rhodospirillaceae bacterium]MBT6218886.1 AAA family ATPase [Rhodospirillaceae bacterium]
MNTHVIVIGNEKGGSGKSTTAMHLISGLLRSGYKVASVDLDFRQGTLTRYLENRQDHAKGQEQELPMPVHHTIDEMPNESWLDEVMADLADRVDIVIIDTPGADSALGRQGHSYADTLLTPMNDSLIDLDVLAHVDVETQKISRPSQYAEMVFQQKIARARRDGGSMDWIVLRNRLSSLDARNKRLVGDLLNDVSNRVGFRVVDGLGERVIFRELFLKGVTMMDLRDGDGEISLSLSHVSARQEVRNLIAAIKLPEIR